MKTTLESITVRKNMAVEIELRKRPIDPTSEDDSTRGIHRTSIAPGDELLPFIEKLNSSLGGMGALPIEDESIKKIALLCSTVWASG